VKEFMASQTIAALQDDLKHLRQTFEHQVSPSCIKYLNLNLVVIFLCMHQSEVLDERSATISLLEARVAELVRVFACDLLLRPSNLYFPSRLMYRSRLSRWPKVCSSALPQAWASVFEQPSSSTAPSRFLHTACLLRILFFMLDSFQQRLNLALEGKLVEKAADAVLAVM
jgi:hypothetical protein